VEVLEEEWHWDGALPIPGGLGRDAVVRGIERGLGKRNDLLIYHHASDTMAVVDFNHASGMPHFIAFRRRGEVGRWEFIEPMLPRVFHFIDADGTDKARGGSYWCIVNLQKLIVLARRNGELLADWTPISAITLRGSPTGDGAVSEDSAEPQAKLGSEPPNWLTSKGLVNEISAATWSEATERQQ
jgi:hypothetical protein